MEMMNSSGITPVYDVADNRRYGGFGDGEGSWIWIFLLFALFGGNGFGGFGGYNGLLNNDTLMNQEFIKRDIFNTNQNVSATACATQREVLGNRFESQVGFSGVQKDLMESRYTTTLGFKDQLYAQQQCCLSFS